MYAAGNRKLPHPVARPPGPPSRSKVHVYSHRSATWTGAVTADRVCRVGVAARTGSSNRWPEGAPAGRPEQPGRHGQGNRVPAAEMGQGRAAPVQRLHTARPATEEPVPHEARPGSRGRRQGIHRRLHGGQILGYASRGVRSRGPRRWGWGKGFVPIGGLSARTSCPSGRQRCPFLHVHRPSPRPQRPVVDVVGIAAGSVEAPAKDGAGFV